MSEERSHFVTEYSILTGTASGITEDGAVELPMLGVVLHDQHGDDHRFAIPPPIMHALARDASRAYDDLDWPEDASPPKSLLVRVLTPSRIMFGFPVVVAALLAFVNGTQGVDRQKPGVVTALITFWSEYWLVVGLMLGMTTALTTSFRLLATRSARRASRRAQQLDGSHEAL